MRSTFLTLISAAALSGLALTLMGNNTPSPIFTTMLSQQQTLSPAINGRVVVGDISLANAQITRTLSIGRQQFVSQVTTDANGQFSFQVLTSDTQLLGNNTDRLWQDVSLVHEGQQYVLWYTAIDHEVDNYIVKDALSSLACDLRSSESEFNITDKRRPGLPINVYSICDINQSQKKPLS